MNPFKTFLFLFVVIAVFIGFQILINEINDYSEPIIPNEKNAVEQDTVRFLIDSLSHIDSVKFQPDDDGIDTIVTDDLIIPQSFVFAENDSLKLSYLLSRLSNSSNQKLPVRILYFGDSQIENDHITSSLRKVLQNKIGGKGIGFVPLDQLYNSTHQILIELSENWAIESFQDEKYQNKSLLFKTGLLDSTNSEGWFRMKRIKTLHPKADYSLLKLYYRLSGTCKLEITDQKSIIYQGSMPEMKKLNVLDFDFNRTPEDLTFKFTNEGNLNVLGVSLESKSGVFVDNIALRGLSYPTFSWSDKESVKEMIDNINPGLFVFHFGVNLVPYPSDNYIYFRKSFKSQVAFLRKEYPEVPFLIIGVSDMAQRKEGILQSYSNIQQIKQIQRQIAEETNSIFWDLEAFMGGPGGMQQWVNANPGLGRKDYIHFTREGAEVIGAQLADLILLEYNKFVKSTTKEE